MNDKMNRYDDTMYQNYNEELAPIMTTKDWIITLLLLMIPIANIVLPFVWAFGSNVNPNKRNYFRATLIFMAIGIFFAVFFSATIMTSIYQVLPQ